MRRFGITSAITAAMMSPAVAGDHPHIWSGVYVGASLGGHQTDYSARLVGFPANSVGGEHSDAIAGGHMGVQHQLGRLVVGVEGSFSGSFSDFGGLTSGTTPPCGLLAGLSCRAGLHDVVTLGPRLGWSPSDAWLIYATGGWATGRLQDRVFSDATGAIVGATNDRHSGWFLGGGIEYALTRNWIVGVEYLHVDFETKFRCDTVIGCGAGESRNGSADVDIVRARLSFKLGRAEAPAPLK